MSSDLFKASPQRSAELLSALSYIKSRVQRATPDTKPVLVAVSKYKPASDILACYEGGQRDFGENYVQELVDKARQVSDECLNLAVCIMNEQLPMDIRWHFIGTLQSNKAKVLASIPNLHTLQTLTSIKAASSLNAALSSTSPPLNVLLQVNTSGEDAKSGLPPLSIGSTMDSDAELVLLAKHVITQCPRLRLRGLMTIGSLAESLGEGEEGGNRDFEKLRETRDAVQGMLEGDPEVGLGVRVNDEERGKEEKEGEEEEGEGRWGLQGKLTLSMGMSSDFEVALKAGSDIVRVGSGIFGERRKKGEES
jgi:PLP dependent protein